MASTIRGSDNFDSSNKLTAGTVQNTTAGTSIDFTGIPSWAKRITIMFNGVSTNGTSRIQVQVGNGSFVTSGYTSNSAFAGNSTSGGLAATSGFVVEAFSPSANTTRNGRISLYNIAANTWVEEGSLAALETVAYALTSAGNISLGGLLDRVRITTVNGTDTFDAGSVNILYE